MKNKPICYVPGRETPEIYSGVPSFLGLPVIESEEDLKNSDIVFMGVPFENVCTWGKYSNVELGTKVIRDASLRYGGYLPDYDLDVFDHFSGADFGDCATKMGDYDFTTEQMLGMYQQILDNDKFPVVFGGDHSISYPLIREFARKHNGKIGVIHFDAHMDNMFIHGEDKYARCSPFARLYEEEVINPKNMVHFGIRGPRNNPSGLKAAKLAGATTITAMEVATNGLLESIKKAIEIASKDVDAIYVTVCSDIVDVANNPAGPPDHCGLSSRELAIILHECGKAGAKAFDFVELYPTNDPNNVSGHLACWMTIYFLAGVTKYKLASE